MKSVFFEKTNVKRAIVFGGGGARGAFEIGVWRALNELDYYADIVTGTSVGALNGALYLTGEQEEAEKLWKELETQDILNFKPPKDRGGLMYYGKTVTEFMLQAIKDKGLSGRALEEIVEKVIDSECDIRNKGIVFGLSVFNYETRETENVYLNDIEEGTLIDYLLASSAFFPLMEKYYIDEIPYIDGGYGNNIPVDIALDEKPDQMVVVDIDGPGYYKQDKRMNQCEYMWIRTNWLLGDMLLFDKQRIEQNINLGYFETMKRAKKEEYPGYWYTFHSKQFDYEKERFYLALHELLIGERSSNMFRQIDNNAYQKKLLIELGRKWKKDVDEQNLMLAVIEETGKIFNISPGSQYEIIEFQDLIIKRMKQYISSWDHHEKKVTKLNIMSGKEWRREFFEQLPLISDRRIAVHLFKWITEGMLSFEEPLAYMFLKVKPYSLMIALYCKYLFSKENKEI
ncbi:patatin-like phospholipase family protein [Alkalibacterium kapii]|uniref:PNPLA domain-containing protein n=1 Tax=Alkalibacterium kapii TaxID=426704 RepID=A0A511AWK9_9LACT|nr:patatin-like phospholipase family protein [Alkalibacterium kapii]GEK91713.1 hypothetical protein AKA01nite_13350 [Alkalibacterium kapii]